MTASESQRVDLYNGLSELMGPERADILMSYLPSTPAAQLATRDDLVALTTEMRSGFAAIDLRFQEIDLRFQEIDLRFQEIDERFEKIDERFEKITEKFERVDERFNWLTDSTHGLYKTIIWSMVASITVMSAIVTLVVYGLTR